MPPAPTWEILVDGVASGGTIDLRIEGVSLAITMTPGCPAHPVADEIAAAINANATLASFDIVATSLGCTVSLAGGVTSLATDDPSLALSASPAAPAPSPKNLPGLAGIAASAPAALLVACGAIANTRRARVTEHGRVWPPSR